MSSLSATPDDIIKKQSDALRSAILEAKKAESSRINLMCHAPNEGRSKELNQRFVRERQHDENKIKNLMNDLDQLKERVASGTFQVHEVGAYNQSSSNLDLTANRFAGYADADDVVSRFLKHVVY